LHFLLKIVIPWVINIISNWGYLGIFICMTIEGSCIPLPSEIIMPFSGFLVSTGRFDFFIVVLLGGLGNVIGSTFMFLIGKQGGFFILNKFGKYLLISHSDFERAQNWFKKFGDITVFGCQLYPIFRTYISLIAGMIKIRYSHFAAYTFLGALVWSSILVYLGVQLGKHWPIIENYFQKLDLSAVILLGILILIFIIRTVKKYREISRSI
jgi:membrane protein DedA with SNARE-associated domain